jgi:predicted metal-dependent peptidase
MKKIEAARLALAKKFPYLNAALWAVRVVITEQVPTMAVDAGWRLYANPAFTENLEPREVTGVLWHELEHLLRKHHSRAKTLGAEPELWNLATDCAINDDAGEAGLVLPEGVCYPHLFGLENYRSEEYYYQALQQQGLDGGDGQGNEQQSGQTGAGGKRPKVWMTDTHAPAAERKAWELANDHAESPAMSEAEAEIVRGEVAQAILEHARSRGNVPAGMLRWAQEIVNPSIPWQKVLAHHLRNGVRLTVGRTRPTYERVHRRMGVMDARVRLPGSYSLKPRVAVVVDTSSSVSDKMLAHALAEIQGLLRQVGGQVVVLSVDADVHTAQRVQRVEQIRLVGGGGTDMRVGIEEAIKQRPRPDVIVVLTDGLTPWPREKPPVPVIAGILDGDSSHPVPQFIRRVDIPLS